MLCDTNIISVVGFRGVPGATPNLTATAETGNPGTPVEVERSGPNTNPVFHFTIPGSAQVSVGAVTTLNPGTQATVADGDPDPFNVVLNFGIPRGDPGLNGTGVVRNTVTDLRNVPAPVNGDTATTLGCNAAGDGGGGLWRYDAGSMAVDNTGTIVRPTAVASNTAGRWLRVYSGPLNVLWFGAYNNDTNATATRVAIQAAMNATKVVGGVRDANSYGIVDFPTGVYLVDSVFDSESGQYIALKWDMPLQMRGTGKIGSVSIKASNSMHAVILAGNDIADTNRTVRSSFFGLLIEGNGFADYGVKAFTNHATFRSCRFSSTLVAGLWLSYGWCCLLDDVEASYNSGDGIVLTDNVNQAVLLAPKIFANNGVGLSILNDCVGVSVLGGTIEANKKTGSFIGGNNKQVFFNGVYFEGNSQNGYVFTTSAATVKAEVVASTSTTIISTATPSEVTLTAVVCTLVYTDGLVFASGLDKISVSNVEISHYGWSAATTYALGQLVRVSGVVYRSIQADNLNHAVTDPAWWEIAKLACLLYYPSSTSVAPSFGFPRNIDIRQITGFTDPIAFTAMNASFLYQYQYDSATEVFHDKAYPNNALVIPVGSWYDLGLAGTAVPIIRSSEIFSKYPSAVTYAIDGSGLTGSAKVYGAVLNAANFPGLAGKMCYLGMWIKVTGGTGSGRLYLNFSGFAQYHTNSSYAPVDWQLITLSFRFPTSGNVLFGVQKYGNPCLVHIAAPFLCEMGADVKTLAILNDIEKIEFYQSAAPTTGTWAKNDIVWNSGVNTSTSRSPGWICTVAGTPGTWVPLPGQGAAVANSVATDVATLTANFNSLLAALRSAGTIASA